jgi:hypothetical protein
MDPDACLAELRKLLNGKKADAAYSADNDAPAFDSDECERAITPFEGLDQWLSRGGFLPKGWATAGKGEQFESFVRMVAQCAVRSTDSNTRVLLEASLKDVGLWQGKMDR